MNTKELREEALKLANQAADIIKEKDVTADRLDEAQRMLDASDQFEGRAANLERAEARAKSYEEVSENLPVENITVTEERANDGEARAFDGWLRGKVTDAEFRAQSVGTPSEGGYLVPTGFVPNLIETMKAFGPMNEGGPITYLNTSTGNPLLFPTSNDTANKGSKIAENATAADTAFVFGQKALGAIKYTSGVVKVSNELLRDSAINLVDFITNQTGERLGRIINEALTIGDGSGDPQGIVVGASAGYTAPAVGAVSYDDLVNLEHSVDPAYWAKGAYMFNSNFLKSVRLLKDLDGRPLWVPSMVVGAPATINGKPYYLNQDMAGPGASNVSALFGDFTKYTARKVQTVGIKRLNERYADADQTGFVVFVSVDGAVMDSSAIKKLTHAAS